MEEPQFHPLDYVSVLNRRKWWLIAPIVLFTVGGAIVALLLPTWYRANVMVGVTSPSVSPDVVKGGNVLDRDERVRTITQQLLSRPLLERVAREEKLGATMPIEQAIADLRLNTSVSANNPLAKSVERPGLDVFTISYLDQTPERTQRVANRIARVFVDETERAQEERAQRSSEFLAGQLRESQDRLSTLEASLRQKKEAYMGRLPEQRDANLQMVANLGQRLESTGVELRSEQDRLSMIERQLEDMRQGLASDAPTRAAAGPQTPQAVVADLQRQLAVARTKYTEKHPEVQRLEQELKDARADLARGAKGADRDELLRTDPTYQQLLADRNQTRLRVATLQREGAATRAQIYEYQRRVEAAPMVEQELAELTRRYELEKTQYGQLAQQHQQALVAEDLERKQGSQRFSVLYPASRPDTPEKPNRPRLMLMAIALGLFAGVGLTFGREYLDRSVYDARSLSGFEVPILAEIPHIPAA